MLRRVGLSFAVLMWLASVASATVTVGTPSVTISVNVSTDAGDQMGGEQFIVATGPFASGSYPTSALPTAFGSGANSAQITNYDLSTGTVWGGTDLGASPAPPPAAGSRKISASDASKNSGGTVLASGLLGKITVDTSGLPAG